MRLAPIILLLLPALALAESPAPLLEQISRETQALYNQAQTGLVRLQVPPPRWIDDLAQADSPARRWDNLSPSVRSALPNAVAADLRNVTTTTRPAEQVQRRQDVAGDWSVTQLDERTVVFQPRQGADQSTVAVLNPDRTEKPDEVLGGSIRIQQRQAPRFSPNQLGILLDDAGHVLVPLYMQAADVQGDTIRALPGEADLTAAKFVGSDRKSGITILKLAQPGGVPLRVGAAPGEGAVVMLLSPGATSARLSIWSSQAQEFGLVITPDGAVAGFARGGRFLALADLQPVIEQIIRHGSAKRPTLGVRVGEQLNQQRDQGGALLVIQEVTPNSAADRGGLRVNDAIVSVSARPVADIASFASVISAQRGPTPIVVRRDGKTLELLVDLRPE